MVRTGGGHAAACGRSASGEAEAKRKLVPAQAGLLDLVYLRHNAVDEVVGHLFGVSADLSEPPLS
jgi:hypothetical protein